MKIKQLAGLVAGVALVLSACADDGAETASSTSATDSSEESSDEMTEDPSGETTQDSADESGDEGTDETTDDGTDETSVAPTTTSGAATSTTTDPTTSESLEGARPDAIVSLSPTATEMLYAIGAGPQVIAVDDFSNYPEEAVSKMQGLSGFEPSVEAIAGLDPDLVVTDGTNPALLDQLDTLEIPHWEGPAATSFDDVFTQIEQLGATTGHVAEAAELVSRMQTDIASVKEALPELQEPLTYYHELDPNLFSVTSETFIGAVYAEMGLVNIADAVADTSFPQLNAEYIIDENPDLIFLACTKFCGETSETLAARPGWGELDAVLDNGVIEMDDDIASRWGPRVVDYLRLAGRAVAQAAAARTVG